MVEDQPDASSETIGSIFDALSRTERRYLLYYLHDRGTATVEELATVLAGWLQVHENEVEIVTPDDRQRVQVSLHHVDLPKLEDEGFVRYDSDSGEVTLDSMPETFDSILSAALSFERRTAERGDPTERRTSDETDGPDREGQ
ncbi:DUF7344 domain-containing protein [Halorussus salinisoli]|uniref:DUF7344 domain-containing protein n=1 Tax=Halorussus salinisoli TaxID=2558242 RepID=UPI0014855F51|nr:hypothetical protein [Halorussus salinisoli]